MAKKDSFMMGIVMLAALFMTISIIIEGSVEAGTES